MGIPSSSSYSPSDVDTEHACLDDAIKQASLKSLEEEQIEIEKMIQEESRQRCSISTYHEAELVSRASSSSCNTPPLPSKYPLHSGTLQDDAETTDRRSALAAHEPFKSEASDRPEDASELIT